MRTPSSRPWRALAMAGTSALLVAGIGWVSSAAAEPAREAPAHHGGAVDGGGPGRAGGHWAEHVQARLDRLAGRLEIKASQEAAWQKYAAAFKQARAGAMAQAHPPADPDAEHPDATTLARRHAEHAQQHAQHLAQLAEATAALEASLSPDQRLVLDEVARHGAAGKGQGGWRGGGPADHAAWQGGGAEEHEGNCSRHGMGREGMRGPRGPAMPPWRGADAGERETVQ